MPILVQNALPAKQILEDFKKQMQGAGLADFEDLLQRIYIADPDSVKFYR